MTSIHTYDPTADDAAPAKLPPLPMAAELALASAARAREYVARPTPTAA